MIKQFPQDHMRLLTYLHQVNRMNFAESGDHSGLDYAPFSAEPHGPSPVPLTAPITIDRDKQLLE